MTNKSYFELILLAAIWGASFMFMRIGVPEFGPFLFMAARTGIAAIFLIALFYVGKHTVNWQLIKRDKTKLLVCGLLNTAIPFVLFGYATLTLNAGMASILNATTPMFGALVAYFWLKESLPKSSILGLIIGFIGVYALVYDSMQITEQDVVLPTLAIMLATLNYGVSANYTKKYLGEHSPLLLATASQIAASLVLIPLSLFFLPSQMPSFEAINAALIIGVVCTGFAYILFFRLIVDAGPTNAISVTYLIPAFGLMWGAAFLNEKVTSGVILGCLLILLGVGLTTGFFKRFKKS
ncbi:DMT family transporter [Thalassotalea agarivorans]|uniref:Permease of the drug/metabolite transporter (DMT) superfamily n=1 Tax=Thalassotalea agarivorans TaxID=349064 RepID=A0A1I0DMG2_THASX|nr:DMT family transporter [Thalassotalea agarivorans]SET33040.1 Permease of the drug/metabolite transporter (DMT) superfamily [Thalassotalea agarivorans]